MVEHPQPPPRGLGQRDILLNPWEVGVTRYREEKVHLRVVAFATVSKGLPVNAADKCHTVSHLSNWFKGMMIIFGMG